MNNNSAHILLTRKTSDNVYVKMLIPKTNIVEITQKDEDTCWLKYWDGKIIRTSVIVGLVEKLAEDHF